jgi:hypothetical protein
VKSSLHFSFGFEEEEKKERRKKSFHREFLFIALLLAAFGSPRVRHMKGEGRLTHTPTTRDKITKRKKNRGPLAF